MTGALKKELHLLQLEGYDLGRLWRYHRSGQKFAPENRTPLVWTWKASTIYKLCFLWYLPFVISILFFNAAAIVVPVLFIYYPAINITLALLTLKPYEIWNKYQAIKNTRAYLGALGSLTTIAITGSFGKTSTKDFLYAILKLHEQETVKSPQSYNTIFGLKKTVDFEVNKKTKYFIAEMGAYVRGEIKELCHMIPPHYSILTAIGTQHLERFGNLQNTTLAKFEVVDSVKPQNAIVNLDNQYIKAHLNEDRYKYVQTYSLKDPKATFYVSKYHLNKDGISFTLKYKNHSQSYSSPLFGTANLENLIGAVSMALLLGIPHQTIQTALLSLKPSPHRLELKKFGDATLIDNAYSSNEQGFQKIVSDLSAIKGKKAILTPGLVELGNESDRIHRSLGEIMPSAFDSILLVGDNSRTHSLEQGIKNTDPSKSIKFIKKQDIWTEVDRLSKTHDWILIENDLPDQY
jgi:UDP-N-acetylmuramoyl-tripeptide--D-alanyl-D-alanine ligase